MAQIELSKDNKRVLLDEIKLHFWQEHDLELSDFQAEKTLDFMLNHAGIYIYNQAIADAHALMTEKTEELFTLEKQIEKKLQKNK